MTDTTPRRFANSALPALMLAMCAALGSCGGPGPVANPPLRLGSYLWPGSYWIDVAVKKGWFTEAGLNVTRVDVHKKYFQALDSVATGSLDAVGFSQFDLVKHVAAGYDLVGVAAMDYSAGAEALVARAGIHSLRELKGKRLALKRGTYLEYLLSIVAERDGLNLADVTLIDRSNDDSLTDFKAGRADAMLAWEPYVSQAIAAGGVSLFSTTDFPGLTYSVLSLRRGYIESHLREVAALLRVWHRAEHFVREHPEETCQIVADTRNETPQAAHELMRSVRVLDLTDNDRAFSYAAGFESLHGSWRRMNDFMLDRGLVTTRVESQDHLDSGFLRQLE